MEGVAEPVSAQIVGQPGDDHVIKALLHPQPPGAPSAYRINSPIELNTQDPFFTHE
jgi:hypothetical protein